MARYARFTKNRTTGAMRAVLLLLSTTMVLAGVVAGAIGCAENGQMRVESSACDFPLVLLPAPSDDGQDALWGYVDEWGDWRIEPRFEDACRFRDGLAPVKVGGRWGYIDRTGSMVIEARFTEAYYFNEGLARVATGKEIDGPLSILVSASDYGFVDKTGSVVIPCVYQDAGDFNEGLAPVMVDGRCGFVDAHGDTVISLEFDAVVQFSEGLACASREGLWGYINKKGEWAIEPTYQEVANFHFVMDETYMLPVGSFRDGLAPVMLNSEESPQRVTGGICTYIDKVGHTVFDEVFLRGGEFSEGLAMVQVDEDGDYLWGFIDTSGAFAIGPRFEYALPGVNEEYYLSSYAGFHEGMAAVALDGEVGYIDTAGDFVIRPRFVIGYPFHEDGFAFVLTAIDAEHNSAAWSHIDRNGTAVY